jgi:hypothetical protein
VIPGINGWDHPEGADKGGGGVPEYILVTTNPSNAESLRDDIAIKVGSNHDIKNSGQSLKQALSRAAKLTLAHGITCTITVSFKIKIQGRCTYR